VSVWRRRTGIRSKTQNRTVRPDADEHRASDTGAGPHVCLGMPLARMETTVAINALLDGLPDLHFDPAAPHEHQRRGVPLAGSTAG
jgi:cytochrome P450